MTIHLGTTGGTRAPLRPETVQPWDAVELRQLADNLDPYRDWDHRRTTAHFVRNIRAGYQPWEGIVDTMVFQLVEATHTYSQTGDPGLGPIAAALRLAAAVYEEMEKR